MSDKQPAVYILASKRNGTLYIGVTSDLVKRAGEHRGNAVEGFSVMVFIPLFGMNYMRIWRLRLGEKSG